MELYLRYGDGGEAPGSRACVRIPEMLCPKGGRFLWHSPPRAVGEWIRTRVHGGRVVARVSAPPVRLIQAGYSDFSAAPVIPMYTLIPLPHAPGPGVILEGNCNPEGPSGLRQLRSLEPFLE